MKSSNIFRGTRDKVSDAFVCLFNISSTSAGNVERKCLNFVYKYTFFYKQPKVSNLKNGLKVKQLGKQPPTLKTLMQKIWFDSQ